MPKEPQIKITISTASYDEIASILEKQGFKLGTNVAEIVLAKGTEITQPVDFRLATIRRDCANLASRVYQGYFLPDNFINFTDEVFQYVLKGLPPKVKDLVTGEQVQPKWK